MQKKNMQATLRSSNHGHRFGSLLHHPFQKAVCIILLEMTCLKGQVPTDKIEYLENGHRGDPMIILCCGQKVRGIKGGTQ